MKITKSGKTVPFLCKSCDCEFEVGIHVVSTPDKGENYYANCPMCGAECHSEIAMTMSVKKMDLEEQNG